MHKNLSFFICFAIFFLPGVYGDSLRKVIIFQSADIHSHIFYETNSWLRIASVLKKKKAASSTENNVLLIDCGDTLTGTVSGYVSKGEAGAIMLNNLGYDVWVPGNHDFELGEKRLLEICQSLKPDILAGNLQWDKKFVKSWKIYKRNGAEIAVIGLTSPHLKKWLWGRDMGRFQVSGMITALDTIIPEVMKASPDMIILAAHHGRYSPRRLKGVNMSMLARRFPQIDLILGAHTHREAAGEKIGLSSWYVSSGAHAAKLAEIAVLIDLKKGNVKKITSKLIPIDPDISALHCDDALLKFRIEADNFESRLIGRSESIIRPNEDLKEHSSMHELFGKAIISASGAIAALHGILDESAEFCGDADKVKEIYGRDLFNVVPFDDTICILYLKRGELIEIVSEQLKLKNTNNYQSLCGITLITGSLHDRNLWKLTFPDGQVWNSKDKRFPIAFSSYALAGAGGRFPVLKEIALRKECRGKNTGIFVRDAMKEYIQKNTPLSIESDKWIKINSSQ